ncbi:MAG TPA: hypothetical protein VKB38_05445 [Terracidiphilus sp.]|nr:hypothetical protein [Terracidiphilus sp.]
MPHTFAHEAPLLFIDIGVGVVGFLLSLAWGAASRTKMTGGKVRVLALAWAGITLFGMVLAFVM